MEREGGRIGVSSRGIDCTELAEREEVSLGSQTKPTLTAEESTVRATLEEEANSEETAKFANGGGGGEAGVESKVADRNFDFGRVIGADVAFCGEVEKDTRRSPTEGGRSDAEERSDEMPVARSDNSGNAKDGGDVGVEGEPCSEGQGEFGERSAADTAGGDGRATGDAEPKEEEDAAENEDDDVGSEIEAEAAELIEDVTTFESLRFILRGVFDLY